MRRFLHNAAEVLIILLWAAFVTVVLFLWFIIVTLLAYYLG